MLALKVNATLGIEARSSYELQQGYFQTGTYVPWLAIWAIFDFRGHQIGLLVNHYHLGIFSAPIDPKDCEAIFPSVTDALNHP